MKTIFPIAALFLIAAFTAHADPQKLAYERDNAVWVANLDGTSAKKISGGQSPDLSPDGTKLAFNTVQPDGQPAHRKIAIADLADGKIKTFDDVPSNNCLGAIWSPDGTKLVFTHYIKDDMRIGFINADGTGYHALDKEDAKHKAYWSVCWAWDGQSIFGQDMENLYHLGLDGSVIKKWLISKIVPKGGMSGDIRLDPSSDGKTLLMDVEMDEPVKRKNWDGPMPSIWTFNLETGKATRITPKTQMAWDSHWLTADSILFCTQAANENEASVYRMNLDGKEKKLLVKNARIPSAK